MKGTKLLDISSNGGNFHNSEKLRKAVIQDLDLESFALDNGKIRLGLTRSFFENEWEDLEENLDLLKRAFNFWRKTDEYIVLERRKKKFNQHSYDIDRKYIAVKAMKRGNSYYRHKLKRKLAWMNRLPGSGKIFDRKDRSSAKKTNVLFVTLTYDTKRCSLRESWKNIGKEYNRWITNLRNKYGKISAFRVWEATKRGYAHIHCLLIFEDKEFVTFPHKGKDGKLSWRIKEKEELEKGYHSNVDVKSVYHLGGQLNYLKKYLLKEHKEKKIEDVDISEEASDKTLALMWLFRKRSYSLSGDLRQKVFDLINRLANSNFSREIQLDLWGKEQEKIEWIFIGCYLPENLEKIEGKDPPDGKSWSFEVKDPR